MKSKTNKSKMSIREVKTTTFKVTVSKLEIAHFTNDSENLKKMDELMVCYDPVDGFTIIGFPEDLTFHQRVKETLIERQEKNPNKFKRVLIGHKQEGDLNTYCLVIQHQSYFEHRITKKEESD